MKAVQSFWSKPLYRTASDSSYERQNGGWLNIHFYYMSWALSCLKLKEFYNKVELVTDKRGKHILIDLLKLPYDNVVEKLDDLNSYHQSLWALGKIYAYSLQDVPFIHFDNDVYVWAEFDSKLQEAPLVAQNIDCNHGTYKKILQQLIEKNFIFPKPLETVQTVISQDIYACNAGIFGGNDLSFFQEYTRLAYNFLDKNYDLVNKVDTPLLNIIFEQYFFYYLAEERNVRIEYYTDQIDYGLNPPSWAIKFWGVPKRTNYIHAIANYKKSNELAQRMAFQLRYEYPEFYYRIRDCLNDSVME